MTETEALEELRTMTDIGDSSDVIDDDDLRLFLRRARRVDAAGRIVTDPEWAPTYDLNWAAREAWTLRQGRASGGFDFTADGATFNRSQVVEHCAAMVAHYNRKLATTWAV